MMTSVVTYHELALEQLLGIDPSEDDKSSVISE